MTTLVPERRPTSQECSHTDNTVVIAADIDLVWESTNDLAAWPELFTEYAAVEILSRQASTWRFRLTMNPDPQGNIWSWVSERTLDREHYSVAAHRIETGWFEFMDIAWTYRPHPDGTTMRWVQDFRMRPDSPIDDATMTARLNTNTLVQMAHISQVVERAAGTGSSISSVY